MLIFVWAYYNLKGFPLFGSKRNQQGKKIEDLCYNFTILASFFFSLTMNILLYIVIYLEIYSKQLIS